MEEDPRDRARRDRETQDAIDRAVRNAIRIEKIESTVDATSLLTQEVRKDIRSLADELRRHTADDNTRFASIDSRFVGEQNQLTQILTTLQSVESKVNADIALIDTLKHELFDEEGKSKLAPLIVETGQRRQFWRALKTQWGFVAAGASVSSAIFGIVVAALKLID